MPEEERKPPAEPAPEGLAPVPPEPEPAPDWANRYKYLLADFDNFRKRAERDRETVRQVARADVLRALLPVYEASERARVAVAHLEASDPVRRGIELLAASWRTFLESSRVSPVAEPAARFEASLHEAVAEAPASREHPAGTIIEVVQQGYRMGNALLRPAKVVVARNAPAESASAAAAAPAHDP